MTALKCSQKTVVQNVRNEMPAKKLSEKIITENARTEMLPNNLPQKQSFKMFAPKI